MYIPVDFLDFLKTLRYCINTLFHQSGAFLLFHLHINTIFAISDMHKKKEKQRNLIKYIDRKRNKKLHTAFASGYCVRKIV